MFGGAQTGVDVLRRADDPKPVDYQQIAMDAWAKAKADDSHFGSISKTARKRLQSVGAPASTERYQRELREWEKEYHARAEDQIADANLDEKRQDCRL